jgi:hypothetical protein
MTDDPKFSPQRSAAIRQLLIENVEAEPRRRSRHVRALLAGLVITAVVASGSTALALNRDALFSAPVPSSSATIDDPTATTPPISTVVPTPTATSSVTMASTPIAPHDVESQPAGNGWSLQLPAPSGTCLADSEVTNVAEGLALVTVGPDFGDDTPTPDGCDLTRDGMSVSLVDTSTGQIVWSREWSWTTEAGEQTGNKAQTVLLSASDKVLVLSRPDLDGPNEVIDLGTGDTVAPFSPEGGGIILTAYAAPDESGEVYAVFADTDESGDPVPRSHIKRLDPLDGAVVWSTPIDAVDPQLDVPRNQMPYAMLQYITEGAPRYAYALLNISTGELSPRESYTTYKYFTGYSIRPSSYSDPVGTPVTLTGLDDAGEQLWQRTELPGSSVSEVLSVNAKPGGRASTQVGNGQFLIANSQGVTLVDGVSGATIWSSVPSSCGLSDGAYQTYDATQSSDGRFITVDSSAGSCRLDSATGTELTPVAIPWNRFRAFGESLVYSVVDGTGTAFDAETGEAAWAVPTDSYSWMYAGGYLVALDGSLLSSVG